MILKLAWRNIWRNKRRTLITTASVFLAVFLALIMRSMQLGSYAYIIYSIVHSYTGYIQVHREGYWKDKDINLSFPFDEGFSRRIQQNPNISAIVPRLESGALVSAGMHTKGALVVGTVPSAETEMTGIRKHLIHGRFLLDQDNGVLVAEKLANYLGIRPNDTLALIGQGYHGGEVAARFPVAGIVRLNSPDLNSQLIYLSLPACQSFYGAGNQVTSVALVLRDPQQIHKTVRVLKNMLDPSKFEVMTWDEMMTGVLSLINADSASGLIMLGILYLVVGFGIFGTILMMTNERIREFGIMISIGTRKTKVLTLILAESFLIGFLGLATGIASSIPIILYYHLHPIYLTGDSARSMEGMGFESLLCFQPPGFYFLNNAFVILGIILLAALYPVRKILSMRPVNAMKNRS
ncbi:MAG TPA: FtsX-like permease family protein [Bacteroidales bacterium]|nr:FtsX-like permease family protein [Bacteroidales bacterium]